ncbi:hypothetical protein [Sphaerisporangium sp. TRM90804]|uniref:hypothetical protein n=1 Tax=Sphaerisporangium sp. TRM90804 TaxID=3031113 RepID=UPI002446C9D0|nr:hypothetical protein [Sphaerisporangium sp. TRM90804]MDH2425643.1 hypothetical protein [Sphaerisporangium sp. TRM90804]
MDVAMANSPSDCPLTLDLPHDPRRTLLDLTGAPAVVRACAYHTYTTMEDAVVIGSRVLSGQVVDA